MSSVHQAQSVGAQVDYLEPDLTPAAARLLSLGAELVAKSTAGGVCDLGKLHGQLRAQVVAPRLSPVQRAIVLTDVLEALSMDDRAQVTLSLMHSLEDRHLTGLGRAALIAMRKACLAAALEARVVPVDRLETELARRGPIDVAASGGTTLVADGVASGAFRRAHARYAQEHSQATGAERVLVLVPREELGVDSLLIVEHLRRCADVLGVPLTDYLADASRSGRFQVQSFERFLKQYPGSLWLAVSAFVRQLGSSRQDAAPARMRVA